MAQIPDNELEDYKRWRKERECLTIGCDQFGHHIVNLPKITDHYCNFHWDEMLNKAMEKFYR